MVKYIPNQIEKKWQDKWASSGLYKIDLKKASQKRRYVLVEFTYPSGDLHIGHWFAFGPPDFYARYSRMLGFDTFFPNGFDAFGLPAENAAIKKGIHPQDYTLANIKTMRRQFDLMGAMYDWDHEVITCLPEYYKWNQWIFLKMLEKGIAYRGEVLSNWCETDQTVLADENVVDGKCWRCGNPVTKKKVSQWLLKITEYAEKLLWPENPKVQWPKSIREGQNTWIGQSEGMEIEFQLASSVTLSEAKGITPDSYSSALPQNDNTFQGDKIVVYTVYPETIFGVTYMVLAPEHPLVEKLITPEHKEEVEEYIKRSQKKSELQRKEDKEKSGVFTGAYVTNPVNGQKVPVWVADYVIWGYGTGAVMGVPGSDHRDFEFAQKYSIKIIRVIGKTPDDQSEIKSANDVLEAGWLVNSSQFNSLKTPTEAREKVKDWLEKEGFGQRKVQYHLHDWSISRQRYWGTPIPVIHCDKCGIIPVPEDQLPVKLPHIDDFTPKGQPPLAAATDWVNVSCPNCNGPAKRETDTMDGFVDNSWYFLRYLDPKNDKQIFDSELVNSWMPLTVYFGGAEHTLGHTLYSRFFVKFLYGLGIINFDEYALKRVNHGIILGPDNNKMSKSRGNVVNPDEQVAKYGADAVRLYLAFIGPYEIVAPWNPDGINGIYHYLQRIWGLQEKVTVQAEPNRHPEERSSDEGYNLSSEDLKIMHKTIKKVTTDLENFRFNTAIAALMEWLNYLSKKTEVSKEEYKTYLLLLAPFAPHITEELWEILKEPFSIHQQSWPKVEEKYLVEEKINIVIQINGRVRETLTVSNDIEQVEIEKIALSSEKVKKFLEGKEVKKSIYIPGKVLSLVI